VSTVQNVAILSDDDRLRTLLARRLDPERLVSWTPGNLPDARWGARAFVLLVHVDRLHLLAAERTPALVVAVTEVEDPLEVDAALRRGADDVTTVDHLPSRLPVLVHRAASRARLLDRAEALSKALTSARRSATLGELTETLLHDLKDPLLVLALDADLLARGLEAVDAHAAEPLHRRIDNMNDALDGIAERVRHLAAFCAEEASIGDGADPSRAAEQALAIVGGFLSNRACVVRSFGTRVRVASEPHRLVQLLVEVLVGMARSLPADGRLRSVTLRTVLEGDEVVVTIQDDAGPREERSWDRMLEPPEDDADEPGLWTANVIAEEMGASLALDVDGTAGLAWRLALPAMLTDDAPPSPRLLLVEDEPLLRRSLVAGLPRDWVVVEAADVKGGRALLLDQDWDCVICDVMLPEGCAEGLYLDAVTTRPGLADRFVFITGGAFTPEARRFVGRLKNIVLDKPFRMADLRRTVDGILGRSVPSAADVDGDGARDLHSGHSA